MLINAFLHGHPPFLFRLGCSSDLVLAQIGGEVDAFVVDDVKSVLNGDGLTNY